MQLRINTDGTMEFIYNDGLVNLLNQGESRVRRASNVEPRPEGGWTADLAPVGGPLLDNAGRGFALRSEALAAEVEWLDKNIIGGVRHVGQ